MSEYLSQPDNIRRTIPFISALIYLLASEYYRHAMKNTKTFYYRLKSAPVTFSFFRRIPWNFNQTSYRPSIPFLKHFTAFVQLRREKIVLIYKIFKTPSIKWSGVDRGGRLDNFTE